MRTETVAVWLVALALGGVVMAQQGPAPAPAIPQGAATQGAPAAAQQPAAGRQGGRGRGNPNAVSIQPGQECPAGLTETRPGTCEPPEVPAPSIVDYRPRSTLVTPEHLVPKAKFPVVDYHGHPQQLLTSPEGLATLIKALDDLNVRVMNVADAMQSDRLTRALALVSASPYKDRIRIMTGVDFRNVGPGWAEKAVAQLEADLKAGAVGIGELMKGFGLTTTKSDGSRLHLDDPELDAFWEACGRLKIPVFIHTGDPQEFFQPIDMHNERWLELMTHQDRRYQADRYPRFETLMTERDNLFRKHPKTTFVMAHLGWHANDLGRVSKMLDEMPNVYAELGAVLYDLGRQPRGAHEFLTKYQDRILFGKDAFEPSEYPYYWRVFETNDEYFDYYRDYHAFWKLYGLGLSDEVLKKIYYKNALKITPGLPQTGWAK